MAEYFSELEVNPMAIHKISDMISCIKSDPREEYPSRDIQNFDRVATASAINSPEVQSV